MLLITQRKKKKKITDKCFKVKSLLRAVRNNYIKIQPENNNESTSKS